MNHTYTNWQEKTHKIITGRIYVIKYDNGYPYKLNWYKNISTYFNICQCISTYSIQLSKLSYITILKPISICGNSRMLCETKQTTVKTKIWTKFPFKRMKLQSENLKQLMRSNFHNKLCQICKLRKENWNKYNTIYLQYIISIETNQTDWNWKFNWHD